MLHNLHSRKITQLTCLITSFLLFYSTQSKAQVIFNYTGGSQNYIVPAGVTVICFTVNGAQGNGNVLNQMNGGLGGRVIGSMAVTPGQVLQMNVGGGGIASQVGGFNGGGNGGFVSTNCCLTNRGGGGGGASDIRIAPYGLANRVAVGGGGGGTGGRRVQGCAPGCGGGGGGGWYGGGGGGAYGGSPGFGGTQVAGGNGGASCCGCPLAPQPGFAGGFGTGGNGGGLNGCNNQAANNPGCAGGVGGALIGGQGPNCTNGTGCPSTWAGASGGGGSNYASAAVMGPAHTAGVNAGNGSIIIIPNCCNQPTLVPVANPNPICEGQVVNLSATGAGTGGTYTWNPGNIVAQNATVSPFSTTTYTVSGTTTMNCIGSATITVTVNPLPIVTPTNNSPVCTGGNINLSVNAATSYTWSGPGGFNSNAQNPTITNATAANAGNYTVWITNASGCTNSAVTTVTVNPTPTITVGNTGPYCAGATINLTVSAGASYTWTGPSGFNSNLQNPTIANSTTLNSGVYNVTVMALGGCISTGTTNVIVNPTPSPTITSNSPVCSGAQLNLFVNPAAASYTWSGPGGFNSNNQNPSISPSSTLNSGTYTVVVTSAAGCTGSTTANVTVNQTPTISAGNGGPYCAGATINLTVSAANNYTWTGPSGFNSNAQNPTIVNSTTLNGGVYNVTIAAVGGCTATANTNVVVNALPTPTATSNSPLCVGNTLNLSVGAFTSYTWSGPNGFTSNAQNPNIPSVTAVNAGNYTVTVTNANGCINTSVVNVVINPLPVIPVNNQTLCVGSTFTLTASGGTAYAWTGPNAFNSNQQNPVLLNAQTNMAGNYSVIVTSAQGCTNSAQTNVFIVTLPTVSIVGNNTVCAQNFNASTNTVSLLASGAANYTWTIPPGYNANPSITSPNIVLTPSVTSVPNIATISVLGAAGSCTSSATFTLQVNPNPTINAVTSQSMCAGTSVTLTTGNASTYTWSPATNLNTTSGPVVIANPANTTVYSVIGTSLGCNSQTQDATVTVVPNPTVSVNPPTPAICLGNNINLTAIGATNYTWSPATALSSTNTAVTNASPTITTTYTVLGSQATCTHVTVVTVSVLGLPSVTVTPTSNTLCMNNFNGSPNTVTLNAAGATSYTWGPIVGLTTNTLNGSSIIGTANGAAVGTGTVIGANGTCTNSATFTVNVIDNPTITVTSASMCAGTSVTLTANNATTYTWSPATNLNTTNGPVVIANPANTTVYSVIGSSVGCNSQTQDATVTVVPNPTVSVNPALPVICLNNNINLTANGATNYTWTPATALSATIGANTTASPTITTTYSVIGEQATCTNVAVVTVTVLGLPSITVTPTSNTLCMNNFNGSPNTVTLNAAGAASYTWGPIVGLNTNTLNGSSIIGTSDGVSALGSGTVIGANGTCTNSATFTVNAIPNPVIAAVSASMCEGTSVQISAGGANTYTWSPATNLNTTFGASVIASPSITSIYSVIGGSVGCNSQSQNATVTVVPNPTISITPGTPTICFGSNIMLTANGATNYTWSPNVAISATTGINVTVNPLANQTYTLIGEQATCTNVAVTEVTVISLPVINVASNNANICMNDFNGSNNVVTFTANGASTYTWNFAGVTPNANNGSVITATALPPSVIGQGTVEGTVGTCTNSTTFSVIIIPNPSIAVTSASMCEGTNVQISASGAATYTWSPANSLNASTGASVIASPNNTTIYSVVGTSLNCNSTTETGTVIVVPNPIITISPVNPTICAGSTVGLGANGATTYTWMPAASVDNPNNANVNVFPMVTTDYTVIGSANACTSTAVRQVTVIQLPTLQAISDKYSLCLGDKTQINANGANSYTWSPSAGLSDPFANFVVANPIVSTTYVLVGNNGVCTASLNVPIEVVDRPNTDVTTNRQKICFGETTNLFATGAQSYSWSPTNSLNFQSNAMVIASPSVSTNYTIIGINYAGTFACVHTKEILIDIVQPVTAQASPSVELCQGESTRLNASGSNTYKWYPSIGLSNPNIPSPYANPKISTVYTVNVSDDGNCASTATVFVKINPLPTVDAGRDTTYNLDQPMYLNAKGTGTMKWIFGEGILCHDCPDSQIMPENSGCYIIETTNQYGCKAKDEVCIEVTKEYAIYVPNIFTPNFDGVNDVFLVYGTGITEIEMNIFDRWGEKLFVSADQMIGWDGTYKNELSKNDVYSYLIKYTTLDGKKHVKTGHVTLMK